MNEGGLEQIFLDGKIQYYSWPCYRKNVNHPRHDAEDMVYDPKRNSIWINSGDGLLEFSLNDKQFRPIDALNELIKSKDYDRGVGIDIDRHGQDMVCNISQWIFLFMIRKQNRCESHFQILLCKNAQEKTTFIFIATGMELCGHPIGVVTVFMNCCLIIRRLNVMLPDPKLPGSLSNKNIANIVPGPQGKMWIGTADGLNIFDPETEKFEVLREKDLPGIKGQCYRTGLYRYCSSKSLARGMDI